MEITEKVFNAVAPTIQNLGYELVEVTYKYEHKAWQLTVYIYKPEGISLNDCEKVHYAIDGILDELDPTEGAPYYLNVSSLGLDRPMKTDKDFDRNLNKEVEVKLKKHVDKKLLIEGVLKGYDDQTVWVEELKTKKEYKLERDNIKLMTLLIKFD
ncbi:MAG TPA: ribosome maturation factor RimP [Clostridia bacterium]|jgi:ribosome maturation factor RimP